MKFIKISFLAVAAILAATACNKAASSNSSSDGMPASVEVDKARMDIAAQSGESATSNEVYDFLSAQLDTEINPSKPVVIDFYATWCGPCKQFAPIFKRVSADYRDEATFLKVDVDKYPDVAGAFGVNSIPTLALINVAGEVYTNVGFIDADTFTSMLDTFLRGR